MPLFHVRIVDKPCATLEYLLEFLIGFLIWGLVYLMLVVVKEEVSPQRSPWLASERIRQSPLEFTPVSIILRKSFKDLKKDVQVYLFYCDIWQRIIWNSDFSLDCEPNLCNTEIQIQLLGRIHCI